MLLPSALPRRGTCSRPTSTPSPQTLPPPPRNPAGAAPTGVAGLRRLPARGGPWQEASPRRPVRGAPASPVRPSPEANSVRQVQLKEKREKKPSPPARCRRGQPGSSFQQTRKGFTSCNSRVQRASEPWRARPGRCDAASLLAVPSGSCRAGGPAPRPSRLRRD